MLVDKRSLAYCRSVSKRSEIFASHVARRAMRSPLPNSLLSSNASKQWPQALIAFEGLAACSVHWSLLINSDQTFRAIEPSESSCLLYIYPMAIASLLKGKGRKGKEWLPFPSQSPTAPRHPLTQRSEAPTVDGLPTRESESMGS